MADGIDMGSASAPGGPVLRMFVRRSAILILTAVALMAPFIPAETSSFEVMRDWNPSAVIQENWRGGEIRELPDTRITLTRRCSKVERTWVSGDSPTRLSLTWLTCPSDALPVLASTLDSYVARQRTWSDVGSVLPGGADRVWPAANGHIRQWIQDGKILYVELECQALSRDLCTGWSGEFARAISAKLGGEIGLPSDWTEPLRLVLVWSLPTWLAAVSLIGLVRKLRSPVRTVLPQNKWIDVGGGARTLKRKAFARKLFIALLCLLALVGFEIASRDFGSQEGVKALVQIVFWTALMVPALIMLWRSGDPLIRHDWLWRSRPVRPPAGPRLLASVLAAVSVVPLFVLLTVWSNFVIYKWYEIPFTNAERAVGGVLLGALLVAGGFCARLAHRIRVSSGLALLNVAAGIPFVMPPGRKASAALIRSTGFSRRGFALWLFDKVSGYPLAPFADFITIAIARHGRVVPDGRAVSRAAVLFASDLIDQTLESVQETASDRLLVVVPPMDAAEFARFKRSVSGHPVLHPLSLQWGSPASLVFAHVPGEGWFGWGARAATEWSYIKAVEDAMAFAVPRWDQALARHGARGGGPARRFDVALLASQADDDVATEVGALLKSLGFAQRDPSGDLPVVVLMSPRAIEDEAWRAGVRDLHRRKARLIPLVCGERIDAAVAPDGVRDINWIRWNDLPAADLFTAICSNPALYRLYHDLAEQAKRWDGQGRPHHLLIGDREHAESMARVLEQSEYDLLSKPDHQARTYVGASLSRLTGTRRVVRRALAGVVIALVVAVFTVTNLVTVVRVAVNTNNMSGITSHYQTFLADSVDYVGLQSAALMLQGDDEQQAVGRAALQAVLDKPWPSSRLGAQHDAYFRTVRILSHETVFTIDRRGSLAKWNAGTARIEWRHFIADDVSALDLQGDGKTIALAAGNKLHVVTPEPWHDSVIDIGHKVASVALVQASRSIAVVTVDGGLWAVQTDLPHAVKQIGKYDDILALRSTVDGGARVLLASPQNGVRLLDAATGELVGAVSFDVPEVNRSAAVGPDGITVAVVDANRRLHVGSLADLRPTGQEVPFDLADLQVASADVVLYGSPQFGVQVFDRLSGLTTMTFSDPQGDMQSAVSSPDGTIIATFGKHLVEIWSSSRLVSLPSPGPVRNGSTVPTRSANGLRVIGGADGSVSIPSRGRTIPAVRGAVTALTIGDDGRTIVVGSDRGELAVLDADPGVVVRKWVAPDGSSIAEVGWGKLAESLVVRTSPGRWWSSLSCNGCGSDAALIDQLRNRLQPCYLENNVREITPEVRARLGVELCVKSPKPEGS